MTTTYTATGRESGHQIIFHGERALAEYRAAVAAGEAEALIGLRRGVDREIHRAVRSEGNCYGRCPLKDAR